MAWRETNSWAGKNARTSLPTQEIRVRPDEPWSGEQIDRRDFNEEETMNDIDKYGQYTVDTWFSSDEDPSPLRALAIMSLGLAGESGEVCEKIKKFIRDGNDDMELLKKELGDVIFYWARICRHFGMVPSDVIATNIKKLDDRRARGVRRGSGDNR